MDRDDKDTYPLAAVQKVLGKANKLLKVPAGQKVIIKEKLGVVSDTAEPRWMAGQFSAIWSDKWFTLQDCWIDDVGQICYSFATDKNKKTPKDRVVRIEFPSVGWEAATDEPSWGSVKYFYQLT